MVKKSNYVFQLRGTLTTSGSTVPISNDLELDEVVEFTDQACVIRNRNGTVIERIRASATGGVMTLLKRGMEQDSEVEDDDLKQEWRDGAICYMTILAPQLVDILEYTEFFAGLSGGEFADEAARDAALGGNGVATRPYTGVYVVDTGLHYNYNLSTNQWESVDTGTAVPNASTTVAGISQQATDTAIETEDDDGSTGAKNFVTPSQLSPTKLVQKNGVDMADMVRISDSADNDKAKAVEIKEIVDMGVMAQFMFGPGTDGDATISGDMTLTRDMYFNNLTVNSGVTLNPGGYRIYVKGKLTNNGTIARNGNNGTNGENGVTSVVAAGGTGGAGLSAGSIGAGGNGGNGASGRVSNTNENGFAGSAGLNTTTSYSNVNGVAGGNGGDGGGGGVGGNGGNGGTTTRGAAYNKIMTVGETLSLLAHPNAISNINFYVSYNGIGGGGGGGSGASNSGGSSTGGGGGGGSAGGVIWLGVKELENNGIIRANGGNGGNAGTSTSNVNYGGSGGGAGGNGGVLFIVYQTETVAGTKEVNGGTGGTGSAGGGSGTAGANGTTGATGTIISIQI